jgi:hypothetical protein
MHKEKAPVNFLVDATSISDRFASGLLGTLFGFAFHPIKNHLEHALRRFGPLTPRHV